MPSTLKNRILSIHLKQPDGFITSPVIHKDRETALRNLIEDSFYHPVEDDNGPYSVELWIEENKLVFHTTCSGGRELPMLVLSLTPYRRIIKDYFLIVQSYDEALRDGKPSRIEAIDMGRRGLHNEGAALLMERLSNKIRLDLDTARRLFTLICVLHTGKTHTQR